MKRMIGVLLAALALDAGAKWLASTLLAGRTVALGWLVELRLTRNDGMALGLFAFIFDTIGGVLFAKLLNLFTPAGKKINPMVGAAGISAFPMSSRVIHKMGLKEDPSNFLLMHAAAANVSGQIASVIAGGLIITIVEGML